MSITAGKYIPPVGFFYSLSFLEMGGTPSNLWDAGFQEVSGISAKMETESINMGGENRFTHKVPKRVTYSDLVLKRGLIIPTSDIADWCFTHLGTNYSETIKPKTVAVSLLDANEKHQEPIMTWVFVNAYPIGWQIESLDSSKSQFVIESLTLTYQYFWKMEEKEGGNFPFQES